VCERTGGNTAEDKLVQSYGNRPTVLYRI